MDRFSPPLIVFLGAGWSQHLRLLAAAGVPGGYTTFSTFSLEAAPLIERHAYVAAGAHIFGSVLFGVLGLWVAITMMRGH